MSSKMWLIKHFQCLFMAGCVISTQFLAAIRLEKHYCGFLQTCAGNRTDVKQRKDSCCRPCECEDICLEKDTCCKDKNGQNDITISTKQECRPAAYRQEHLPNSVPVQSYFTRTHCPILFNDRKIKDKCERDRVNSFEDITLVSSENGAIVYKNKFCAMCHGEQRTLAWDIMARCIRLDLLKDITKDQLTERLLSHCILLFRRPNNLDYRSTMCFDKDLLINKCNMTGNWKVYNSELQNLCLHPPESAYYLLKTESLIFDNVYCYLCNTKENSAPSTCPNLFVKFTANLFFQLLNQNIWTKQDKKNNEERCTADQVWDTYFNRCRRLYCPRYSLPSNGQCVIYGDVNFHYEVNLQLIPLERIYQSESIKDDLRSRYISIQRKLGFGECQLCSMSILLEKDSGEVKEIKLRVIYISFFVSVTKKCKREDMWTKLTSVQRSKHIQILLNNNEVLFRAVWIENSLHEYYYQILLHKSIGSCYAIQMGLGITFCPRVILTMDEYGTVQKNHSKADKIFFEPNLADINGTIFVCFDSFYRLEQRATGVMKQASVTLSMFMIFVTCCISIF